MLNRLYWIRHIPEHHEPTTFAAQDDRSGGGQGLRNLRAAFASSPLLGRPLIVTAISAIIISPLLIVYFRDILHVPAYLVIDYTLCATIGMTASLLVWGRITDSIGFRPLMTGIFCVLILALPLHLLVTPFPVDSAGAWYQDPHRFSSATMLCVLGVVMGACEAGLLMGMTSIQHHFTTSRNALQAMAAHALCVMALKALAFAAYGWFISGVVSDGFSHHFAQGFVHIDAMKLLLVTGLPTLALVAIAALSSLPNVRTDTGLVDFFASLSGNALRGMAKSRHLYHDDEQRRIDLAHWYASRPSPVATESLLQLLEDPAYDVKRASLRALAQGQRTAAGPVLHRLLQHPEYRYLAPELCRTLGEIRYTEAADTMLDLLDKQHPPATRAAAARSLAKIGEKSSGKQLREILIDADNPDMLRAAAAKALCELRDAGHADELVASLHSLRHTHARFEIALAMCQWLDLPYAWLLRAPLDSTLADVLLSDWRSRSVPWQAQHQDLIDCLVQRDQQRLIALAQQFIARAPPTHPLLLTIFATGRHERNWNPVSVMMVAAMGEG